MPQNLRVNGPLVHDGLDFTHVELCTGLLHVLELVVEPDVHAERTRLNQVPRCDELAYGDFVGHVAKHRRERLLVPTFRSCGEPQDDAFRRLLAERFHNPHVAISRYVVALVAEQRRHPAWHRCQVERPTQRLHHAEGRPAGPCFALGVEHIDFGRRVIPLKGLFVLGDKLVAVLDDEYRCFLHERRKNRAAHDRLTCASWRDS